MRDWKKRELQAFSAAAKFLLFFGLFIAMGMGLGAWMGLVTLVAAETNQPPVAADRIEAGERAVVAYDLPAATATNGAVNAVVIARFGYERPAADADLRQVIVDLPAPVTDGTHTFWLKSKDGAWVGVEFDFHGGALVNARIIPPPLQPGAGERKHRYLVVSRKGYEVCFTVQWSPEGELRSIGLEPVEHPFRACAGQQGAP